MVMKQCTSDSAVRQSSLLRANSSSRARSCSTEASRCRERERSRGRSHQQRSPRGSAGSRSRSGSRSDAKLPWANKVRSGSSSSGDNNGARHEPLPSTPFRGRKLTRRQAIQQAAVKATQCETPTPATTLPDRFFRDALKGNSNAEGTSEATQTAGAQTP
ncbi:hypothetical protein MRX96_036925 [Rhipicephalus microplus]